MTTPTYTFSFAWEAPGTFSGSTFTTTSASIATTSIVATTPTLTLTVGETVTWQNISATYEGYYQNGTVEDPVLKYTLANGTFYVVLSPVKSLAAANYTIVTNKSYTYTACYHRGSRIATPGGEVVVEDLAIGDSVLTSAGESRAIRWVGTRCYPRRFAARHSDIRPVLIRAGALDEGVPSRDLYVSPQHAMLLDGVLVPAKFLLNDTSILQPLPTDTVEYYHIELDTHDVILAEGAASETYVNDGNRGMFQNAAEFASLYPEAIERSAQYCAERVEGGPMLDSIRARLADVAAGSGAVPTRAHYVRLADSEVTCVAIPPGVAEVHLCSPAGRYPMDSRALGVLVARIKLDGALLDLAGPHFTRGFHPVEQHGVNQVRWTTGAGVLGIVPSAAAQVLEVMVAGRYRAACAA